MKDDDTKARMMSFEVRFIVQGAHSRDEVFDALRRELEQQGCVFIVCRMDEIAFIYEGARTLDDVFAMAVKASRDFEHRVRILVKQADGKKWRCRV